MGFFNSSSPARNVSTYKNNELDYYTNQYRTAAPWGFATLDPTATLAAMGDGTALGRIDLGKDYKDYLKGLSADEKKETQRTEAALQRIQQRQESGQFLTPQETEFINTSLDKAFESSRSAGYADWEKATQMMAGSRGMRMSDTPVAEPALKELRNFEVGLGSKRAELGLSATLDYAKNQQNFDASFAQFQQQLGQNRWNARQGFLFGGGAQGAANIGYTNTTESYAASMTGFQKVMAGMQMMSGLQAIGTNAMTAGMTGTPSSSVGGSSLGSSQGWGSSVGSIMGGAGSMMAASDRRLKSDIKRIGTHKTGIGIYSYTIDGHYDIGVMADEVRTVMPAAVQRQKSGYDFVDYAQINK